jgi:hypothetical protein
MLRTPLVQVGGQLSELPAGDTISSTSVQTMSIEVWPPATEYETSIDIPGLSASNDAIAWLARGSEEDENEVDLLESVSVKAYCEADKLIILWASRELEVGVFELKYIIY